MVYYPSLPLIMKSEPKNEMCSQLNNETQMYQNFDGFHRQPQQQQQQQQQHHQQQQQQHVQHQQRMHHQEEVTENNIGISNTNINSNVTLIPSTQIFLNNIKTEQQHQDHHSSQIVCYQPQQIQLNHSGNNGNNQNTNSNNVSVSIQNSFGKVQYKCEQCNMTFGSKGALTSHMKSHIKINTNYHMQQTTQTSSLPSSSATSTILSNNVQQITSTATTTNAITSTNSDPYQCNVCQKTFAVPARLIRHYRTHTGERPFECEYCHKTFSVKENLQVHRRIHTKERPYKCDVCGRAFEHSGKLHRHMRIHTGERPHKCSVCNKTFIQSGQLVIHMRTHTGEKPYKCPVEGCGKGFTCSKQLKVHSRTHTGEKPYHCDICFRDFGYNHVLKLHRVQHYGSKCYKCTICEETFKSKKEMEAHIKGHANEIPDDDDESPTSTVTSQLHNQKTNKPIISETISSTSPSSSSKLNHNLDVNQQQETEKNRDSLELKTTSLLSISPVIDNNCNTNSILNIDAPMEISSETNCGNGENLNIYENVYECFDKNGSFISQPNNQDQNINNNVNTINPALLAAASIASRRIEEKYQETRQIEFSKLTTVPKSSGISLELISHSRQIDNSPETNNEFLLQANSTKLNSSPTFSYEPLEVIRQRTYLAPAPVAEFRSSLRGANNIVRQVEAAIAGAEPLLTPPRSSSTESPERSSSPESDSMMMADRDIMTLPLRKRKLYLKDNQSKEVSPVVRMNSVIQFARAS